MKRNSLFFQTLYIKSIYISVALGWSVSCSSKSTKTNKLTHKYNKDIVQLNQPQNAIELQTIVLSNSESSFARFYIYGDIKEVDHGKIHINHKGARVLSSKANIKEYVDDIGKLVQDVNVLEVELVNIAPGSIVSLRRIEKDAFSLNNLHDRKTPEKDMVYKEPLKIYVSDSKRSLKINGFDYSDISELKAVVEYYRAYDYNVELENSFRVESDTTDNTVTLVFDEELSDGTYRVVLFEGEANYLFSSGKVTVDKKAPHLIEVESNEEKLKIISSNEVEIRMNEFVTLGDKNNIALIEGDKKHRIDDVSLIVETEVFSEYGGEDVINDNFSITTRIILGLSFEFGTDVEYGIELRANAFIDRHGNGNLHEMTELDIVETVVRGFIDYDDLL